MSAAEEIVQKEIRSNEINERLTEVEEMMKSEKVKLPDDVFKRVADGLKEINRKLSENEPVFESDFDFVEELKFVIKVGQQYNGAIENLKGGDLYNPEKPVEGDKKAPAQDEAIHALMTKLTPNQKEVIAQMKNPVLLVKPITTWKRFAKNLNSAKQIGTNTRESEWTKNEKDAKITNNITGWEVGFVEGAQELDGKFDILGNLITEWQNGPQSKKGAKLVTNNEYMLLMARSIKKGIPIDIQNWSVLRGESREEIIGKDGRVSNGNWYGGVPYFDGSNPGTHYDNARFRVAVMVKI